MRPPACVFVCVCVCVRRARIWPIERVERAGRLTLLCTSIVGMASTLLIMGVYFWEKDRGRDPPDLALPATMVYMLSFAIGLGPIPWLVINEIFPDDARGTAGSMAVLVNWVVTERLNAIDDSTC